MLEASNLKPQSVTEHFCESAVRTYWLHHYDTRETLQLRHNVEDLRNEVQRKLNMYTLGRKQVDLLCQRATSSNLKAVRRVDLRLEARGEQLEAMVDDMHEMRQEFEGAIAGC